MDSLEWNITKRKPRQKKSKYLTGRLQEARNKLTPIVDVIISSAYDLIQKGDNKFFNEATLTAKQYGDVMWASQIMNEIVYDFNSTAYKWPNTDIIVNNVSVEYKNRMKPDKDKSVVIDEVTIVQLLELYERMGDVIQKITEEANQQNEVPIREKTKSNLRVTASSKSVKSEKSRTSSSERPLRTTSSSEKNYDLAPHIKSTLSVIQKSSSGELNKKHGMRYNNNLAKSVSKEANTNVFIRIQCISDGSEGERDEHFQTVSLPAECDKESTPHYHLRLGGEPVTLKVNQANVEKGAIYCVNTDTESDENDVKIFIKQCPECLSTVIGSTSKIRGMPGESHESVTLHGKGLDDEEQMAYSTDGTVESYREEPYRGVSQPHENIIPQQSSHRSFRKQDSSTRRIHKDQPYKDEPVRDESPRSVKASSESECVCKGQRICIDISASICSCDRDGDGECRNQLRITTLPSDVIVTKSDDVIKGPNVVRASSYDERSANRMDLLVDADNVDKSTVKFSGGTGSSQDLPSFPEHGSSPTSAEKVEPSVQTIHSRKESQIVTPPTKQKSVVPLMRRRICSSMEFDVTTVNTRLREHELEHNNSKIVVELKDMGVDHLLRACRPAKCCRKAILDERQRTALPYCVSLRSLPLMGNDVEVIKQSYDMSLRKIKNALDLTQNQKDKLAYYVGLGRDDFKPNINFPWVIPVYDMKQSVDLNIQDKEKFYILKKFEDLKPRNSKSMNSMLKLLKDKRKQQKRLATKKQRQIRAKRYFVLKRLEEQEAPHKSNDRKSQVKHKKRGAKQNSRRKRKVRFKETVKVNHVNSYLDRVKEWSQSRGTLNRTALKNIWNNFGHGDQVVFFDRHKKEFCNKNNFDADFDNILFNFKSNVANFYSRSESNISSHYESLSQLLNFDFYSNSQNRGFYAEKLQDLMEAGDYPHVPIDEMIEVCLGNINGLKYNYQIGLKKSFSDTQFINRGRNHMRNIDSPNFWDHISEELFYTSSGITVFMKRTRSMGKITKMNESCKQVESEISSYINATRLEAEKENKRPEIRKKLEYYVSLVNGDLVWSQNFPLKPQKYDAYYNYSDNASTTSPRSSRTSREQNFTQRNTLDAIPPYPRQNNSDSRPIPTNSAESESPYAEWAPFLVSDHSLPALPVVEQMQKVQQVPVETAVPKPTVNKECAQKQTCIDNKCKACPAKVCERPKKKCHGQGQITIGIQKTKSKCNTECINKSVEKSYKKEVRELYKNKTLVPEKKAKSSKEPCDPCENKTLTFKAKDNIQIVIKDRNISVVNDNKKCKK